MLDLLQLHLELGISSILWWVALAMSDSVKRSVKPVKLIKQTEKTRNPEENSLTCKN